MKKQNGTLNTILTLAGIFAGAYLITKLTHQDTDDKPLSKESSGGEKKGINKTEPVVKEEKIEGLNSRQIKILNVVKEKGIITPKNLQSLVPDVSSRTLRRDMDALAKLKYISQKGSTKSTFYKYIGE